MKKILLYFLAALLTFIASMVALAPAGPIWNLVSSQVRVPNFQVHEVRGTIWNGQANLQYQQFPPSWLIWHLEPLPLLTGTVDIKFSIAGVGHKFEGQAQLKQTGFVLTDLHGVLQSQYINSVSQPQGLTFAGDFEAGDVGIISDLEWFSSVTGRIYWPGGRIVSSTPAGTQVFDLPGLTGDLKLIEDRVQLLIHHELGDLIDIQLKPDGWIVVAIKARLFDLAKLPMITNMELQDTMLEFEEKIF